MGRRGAAAGRALRIAVVLALAISVDAEAVEVRYEAGLLSHYIWRGITLTDDPVLQPSVTISHDSGISFEVWGNVELGDDNDTPWEVNETRFVLDYGRKVGGVELGVGLVEYLFPNSPFPGTREVYLRLGVDALVAPRLELYYDVDEIKGGYARLALTYEHALGPSWRYALELSAGYADAAVAIGDQAGLHDGGVEMRIERAAGPLELRFLAGWSDTLDSAVLPEQPTSFWTGFSFAYRF